MILEIAACAALSKALVMDKIKERSMELGAYPEIVSYIVDNEAVKDWRGRFMPCGDGDQHLTDPNGNPHRSRGIVQINDYWHPDVTDAQAYDPDFAIEFLIKGLRAGKCREWTTCRQFKKDNPDHEYFRHE